MSVFTETLFNLMVKIQVVHSLPGRLRISLPQIKNLPQEFSQEEELIKSIFLALPGIEHISVSYITGTVLINYDFHSTSEKKILAYIKKVLSVVNRSQRELINPSSADLEKEINRIKSLIVD